MNREIKFRIWNSLNDTMTYPDRYCFDWSWFGVSTEHYLDDSAGVYPIDESVYKLMQFTGLQDKNGKDIYEGDIIRDNEYILIIVWDNTYCSFCLDRKGWMYRHWFGESCDPKDCEIIGNVHQNPELL